MTTHPFRLEIDGAFKGIVDAASPLDALFLLFATSDERSTHVSFLHFSAAFCRAEINHQRYVITRA